MSRCIRRVRSIVGDSAPRALVAMLLCASTAAGAQTAATGAQATKVLAPRATATVRHTETLDVPQSGGTSVAVKVELGTWHLTGKKSEIQIPPQGDYIAELRNGEVKTVIDGGAATVRHSGDLWTVRSGQAMAVTITGKRQNSALLRVFTLKPQ